MAGPDFAVKQGDSAIVFSDTLSYSDARAVTAATTAGSTSLTGIAPLLASSDVGAVISGPGIPAGTTIASQAGSTATLSANATLTQTLAPLSLVTPANLTGATVNFVMRTLTAATPAVNAAATIVGATVGMVSYTPTTVDTAVAGEYMAQWIVTFSNGKVEQFPTDGYLWVEVQQNITTTGGQMLVSLPALKDRLNLYTTDRRRDAKLLSMITGVTPVIEQLCGDVLIKQYDEWYDGGQTWIRLRHRPIHEILAVTEFRGPIPFNQAIVADPGHGQIYSVMNPDSGTIRRRTAGGGVMAFPGMPDSVHVVYTAGRTTVPENIREGTLDLLQIHFQQTQQGRPPSGAQTGATDSELSTAGQMILGFYVPNRVREQLMPTRKAPAIF